MVVPHKKMLVCAEAVAGQVSRYWVVMPRYWSLVWGLMKKNL